MGVDEVIGVGVVVQKKRERPTRENAVGVTELGQSDRSNAALALLASGIRTEATPLPLPPPLILSLGVMGGRAPRRKPPVPDTCLYSPLPREGRCSANYCLTDPNVSQKE